MENSSKARQGSKTKGTEHCISRCENFARCISRCELLSRKGGNFAHLKTRCEIPCSKCEIPKCHFRTTLFKVRKFSHRAKFPPGTRVPFSHTSSQISHRAKQGAKFSHSAKLSAKCYPRCEFLSPKGAIFAHLNPRCEIDFKVRKPLFEVRIP